MEAETEYESEWIFEGIIQFLMSPRWKVPVLGFIDENCIIFELGVGDEGEYKKQHDKFKKIIDGLFDTLMKELGITKRQFNNSCQKAKQKQSHKKIVDQIKEVDNYDSFKALMVKRNKELKEKALNTIRGGSARAGHAHPRGMAAGGGGRAHDRREEAVEKARHESHIEEAKRVSQALEEQRKIPYTTGRQLQIPNFSLELIKQELRKNEIILEELTNELDDRNYVCPIELEILEEPVIDEQGITYEKANIERWLNRPESQGRSPISRKIIQTLVPNLQLKAIIQEKFAKRTKIESQIAHLKERLR